MRPHLVDWLTPLLGRDLALLLAPTWFTCVGLAGLVALLVLVRLARRHGIDPRVAASAILWGYLAAVTAGIVVPMAIDAVEQYVAHGRVQVRWAGMTSFWGYLAGGAAVVAVCRRAGVPLARFADLMAMPLGLALVFARLGCFVAGCDFGKVTSSALALRFPAGSPAWHAHVGGGLVPPDRAASLPVHPAQLYEAALGLVIVAVALVVGRTRWGRERAGARFLAVAATYAIGRLLVEELRGDRGRGFILGLASGQVFALLLLAAVAVAIALQLRAPVASRLTAVAAALALLAGGAAPARAQEAPSEPPAPDAPAAPDAPPAEPPATLDPYGAPAPLPPPPPPAGPPATSPPSATPPPTGYPVVAPRPAPAAPTGRPRLEAALHLGLATPLNRGNGEVPPLAGPTLSIGVQLDPSFAAWLDLDSLGNEDAAHGTVLVSGGYQRALRPKVSLGARAGIGATLVNFDEPAFRDIMGLTLRGEAIATVALGERWFLSLRPLSFDLISAAALGGPILSWQVRGGLGYRFGPRSAATP